MKIKKIFRDINKSEDNKSYIDMDIIAEQFNVQFDCYGKEYDERLKAYWAARHICTDTWVGVRVYYFDDEPAALSWQFARKSSEDFQWVSNKIANKVKDWILSLSDDIDVALIDMDEDYGDGYEVSFVSQLLDNKIIYDGELVDVIGSEGDDDDKIIIKTENDEKIVNISDCLAPWRVK